MTNKPEHWKLIADQWRQSGISQKEFCDRNKIKLTTLHYWMGRIKKAEKKVSQGNDLVCITMPSSSTAATDIVLEIDRRYRLTLPNGFSPDTLRQVLEVIG